MVLRSIERVVEETEPIRVRRRFEPDPAVIPATGKVIDLTNEQIHDLLESS